MGGGIVVAVILILSSLVSCRGNIPAPAVDVVLRIEDGLRSSKLAAPDSFIGVEFYRFVLNDKDGAEVIIGRSAPDDEAILSGIIPGTYNLSVEGCVIADGKEVVIVEDSDDVTISERMTSISMVATKLVDSTGSLSLTVSGIIPEGYTFIDKRVVVKLMSGDESVKEFVADIPVDSGEYAVEMASEDVPTGVYEAVAEVDGFATRMYVCILPGLKTVGEMECVMMPPILPDLQIKAIYAMGFSYPYKLEIENSADYPEKTEFSYVVLSKNALTGNYTTIASGTLTTISNVLSGTFFFKPSQTVVTASCPGYVNSTLTESFVVSFEALPTE